MSKDLQPGMPVRVAEGVQRLVAPNPGMMTGPGTNSYLFGEGDVIVVDPGPAIEQHIEAIRAAAVGKIRYILVTHTHSDHSPAAMVLAEKCGATVLGRPAPVGWHQDTTFQPARVLEDGECIAAGGVELRVLHTPGHASNHLCFLRETDGLLVTGDHIINGSTVVIDPPDGSMKAYLESLARLRKEPVRAIAPGHGAIIDEPLQAIDWIIRHRLEREEKVAAALRDNPGLSIAELTAVVYADVDEGLHRVAVRSLLAHLLKLDEDGRASCRDECWYPA
jgi:glyoxylase-like metal-dependent hydrolase (beta-lactamase superfamily II)